MQGLCTKAGESKGVASKTIYFIKVSLSCSVPCMLQGPPPPKKQTNRGKIPWIFQQGVDLFEKFLPPPGALFFKPPFSGSRSRLVRWRMAKGAGGGLRNFDGSYHKRWDFPWPYQFSRGCIYILYIYIYISAFKSYASKWFWRVVMTTEWYMAPADGYFKTVDYIHLQNCAAF